MAKKKLSNVLNLADSLKRVLREERRGRKLIPDVLRFCDCETLLNDSLSGIEKSLDAGSYTHHPLLTMDVPKDNFCIRPAAVPSLENWIIYDAFTNYIGRNADSKLDATVFSYRFSKSGELLPGVKQWTTFENSFRKAFESSNASAYILVTDIASYFANINLDVLRNNLLTILNGSSKTNERVVNSLFNILLTPWAQGPIQSNLGIPQGVDASSIVGNLLLHHVDAEISKIPGIKYFRYVDDIKIVAPDKVTAKKTLRRLIKALGEIGLDVNPMKTRILDKESAKALRDPRADDMNLVDKLIRSKKRITVSLAVPILMRMFDGAFNPTNNLYQRHLSFAINRFVLLRNQLKKNKGFVKRVSKVLISNFEKLPGCTQDFNRFFRNFPSAIYKTDLVAFLHSKDNIYEWQEMWILDSLLRFQRGMAPDDVRFFDEIARDRRKHKLCRAKAILLVGKFGNQHDRHELTTMYKDESDPVIKRAIMFACQELAQAERNTFYEMMKTDEKMKYSVAYIKKLKKPKYPKYYEEEDWTPIDVPDWGTY